MSGRKDLIIVTIVDTVADFTYYNRKGDDELPLRAIEHAIKAGDMSVDEIVAEFEKAIREAL